MCLEILVNNYILKYVPGAVALTDPPLHHIDIFKQRRRWINGSLFAGIHVLDRIATGIWYSSHSRFRKFIILALYTYMLVNMLFGLLLVGSLMAAFSVFMNAAFPTDKKCQILNYAKLAERVYVSVLIIFIIMCVTMPLSKARLPYVILSAVFGLLYMCMLGSGFFYLFNLYHVTNDP